MWSRIASDWTWVYIESRNRAAAEARAAKLLGEWTSEDPPPVVQHGVKPPARGVVYTARPRKNGSMNRSTWTYIDLDGETWRSADELPDEVRRARDEFQDGLGLA